MMRSGLNRRAVVLLCGFIQLVSGCDRRPRQEQSIMPAESHGGAQPSDSVRAVIAAYEIGALTLDSAVHRLADLVEPTGGLAAQPGLSPRATKLLEATGRELRYRSMRSSIRGESQRR